MARVDGKRLVPLNVMCSMKWATPASAGVSRREPARTYAAMETERAPGSLALITRGPAGSAVRSNIAADGTGTNRASRRARIESEIVAPRLLRHSLGGYPSVLTLRTRDSARS